MEQNIICIFFHRSPSRPKSEIRPAPVKPPRVSPGAKQKSNIFCQ